MESSPRENNKNMEEPENPSKLKKPNRPNNKKSGETLLLVEVGGWVG